MKEKDILKELPTYDFDRTCQKCGSKEWESCNLTDDGKNVSDCNKCEERKQ